MGSTLVSWKQQHTESTSVWKNVNTSNCFTTKTENNSAPVTAIDEDRVGVLTLNLHIIKN